MKAWVESYGCTMNQGEGAKLEAQLASMGHTLVSDPADAELVVVNTCTVIKETERRMLRRLEELSAQRKNVIVTGCLAAVQSGEAVRRAPNALVVPPRSYISFTELVEERYGPVEADAVIALPTATSAVVPIAQGCLGNCSYCITRLARGTLFSYPPEGIVEEARRHLEAGAGELLLTAQDTAAYGMDRGTDLGGLLGAITSIPGDFRIRVGMMNPQSLAPVLPSFLSAWLSPKVYQFIHLPVQSGSDRILRAMNRRHTVKEFEALADKLRSASPGMSLATDVITGFPGETDEDHRATVELMGRIRPDTINITRYSPRPGTEAARARSQVPGWMSKERSRELTALRADIGMGLNLSRVGMEEGILITERGKEGTMIGRTDAYRPVAVRGDHPIGTRLAVVITDAAPSYLIGEAVGT